MNLNEIKNQSGHMWALHNGDNTFALNYKLNDNSTIIDLGGFHGKWADMIISKYNPNIILVEPIPEFYKFLCNKFKNNPKISVLNYGISTTKHDGVLFLDGDATSKYIVNTRPVKIKFITIQDLLNEIGKTHIDLIQINIEGEEYPLLEKMVEDDSILNFDNIQIQYHIFVENAFERRLWIQERMLENFHKNYDYSFIFEGWTLKPKQLET